MDRDKRWERISTAYELLVDGRAAYTAPDPAAALAAAYARGETDEFVKPTAIVDAEGRAGDDGRRRRRRVHELPRRPGAAAHARASPTPRSTASRATACRVSIVTSASRATATSSRTCPSAFAPQSVANSFGEYVAKRGLAQLRIAETEKYAHVTYFFSGGVEAVYPGEDRILVPSPRVATYDLQPEMSAPEVTARLVAAIEGGKYDAIVCNYANCDMVGHTGDFDAAKRAVETLDSCIDRVVTAARKAGGEVLITADHGNAEQMYDAATGPGAHGAHAQSGPLRLRGTGGGDRAKDGALKDIAPTLLAMMGLPAPAGDDRPFASYAFRRNNHISSVLRRSRNLSASAVPETGWSCRRSARSRRPAPRSPPGIDFRRKRYETSNRLRQEFDQDSSAGCFWPTGAGAFRRTWISIAGAMPGV